MTDGPGDGARPHFVFATGGGERLGTGVAAQYTDPRTAAEDLRAGIGAGSGAVVGALPFDLTAPAALTVPEVFSTRSGAELPAEAELPELPALTQIAELPAPDEHIARVRRGVDRIRAGALQKVVLARAVDFGAAEPIDPLLMAEVLRARDASGNGFAVDLTPAGPAFAGRWLVGSTPEILVRRDGDRVSCHPFAGTATEPDGLLESRKDREEHAYVVDEIAAALAPLCKALDVPASPSVSRAGPVWHLGTMIVGRLKDPSTTALDLALALHPTPAVCGFPRAAAAATIAELEGDRGFYAGAVGWTNADGDGQWRVTIRCAELDPDGLRLRAAAGGGIVAASDPEAELAETRNKLRTVLGPFRLTAAAH